MGIPRAERGGGPVRFSLLGALFLLAAGCALPPCPDRPPARVQLLSVNDTYVLEPDGQGRGGLARVATLVRRLRQERPATLFVLAGDTLSPSLLSSLFRGRHMVEAWNALGLDVATFGNHEFDFGPATLLERMRESRFLWLSANVRDRSTGRPFGEARRALLRDLDGARVGLIGLTLAETANTSNPGPGVVFAPPLDAARAAVAELGAVDLRVALTHLELRRDRELAEVLPLHVILGGHDHDPIVEEHGRTLILKPGADAVNLGQVQLELGCGGTLLGRRHRLIPVEASIPAAADVLALVDRYAAQADRELDQPAGEISRPLDAREAVTRREETPVGRFLAELMRERMGADVGLLNSGAIRGNRVIPPGTVTRRDFRTLLPFDNVVVLLEVPGAALRQALERSVASLPRPAGAFLQTAGLSYSADLGRPPGERITRLEVGGRPLRPEGRYRVAVPDFLARGGDGYAVLKAGRPLVSPEEGPGLIDTVLEAVARGRFP